MFGKPHAIQTDRQTDDIQTDETHNVQCAQEVVIVTHLPIMRAVSVSRHSTGPVGTG